MNSIIDLGMHSFADTFIGEDQYGLSEPVYPLQCVLNPSTGEIKLKYETNDDQRYNLYNYSYTSSNSKVSRQHWIEYCNEVNKVIGEKSKILEVGSNDGFLTKQFIDKSHITRGVDPSKEMSNIATTRGVKTYNMLFNSKNIKKIVKDFGRADVVLANNVFNHANNPSDFMEAVSKVLTKNGTFIFELPYWLYTVKDKRFDQIYHEHVTYFTVKYAYNLLKKHGFEISSVKVVDYHGGSLRIYSTKKENVLMNPKVSKMIKKEEKYKLFDSKMYKKFMKTLKSDRNSFMSKIYKIKKKGIPIVGVGASAKANTFLNFYNIDNTILDFITDASEYKKGKYTPLTRIPIVGDEIFSQYDKVYALILSWNISDMLVKKIKSINKKVKFLSLREIS